VDFAVDRGAAYVGHYYSVRRVGIHAHTRATPYRAPKGYRIGRVEAAGGRLAIAMGADVEPGGPLPRVDSVAESGGPPTVVAKSRTTNGCYRSVWLEGVTAAGETVTDEMDCHAPLVDYPGTLFAYEPGGARRVFGTHKVPDPYLTSEDAEIRVRGEHYVVHAQDPRGPGQSRVFVGDRHGARRLMRNWLFDSLDVDGRGNAAVAYVARGRPYRGHQVVKLFRPGRPPVVVADAKGYLVVRFCGRRLAIAESTRDSRLRLTVRDTPTGKPRVLMDRRTTVAAQIDAVECDAHDLVFRESHFGPYRVFLRAKSLDAPTRRAGGGRPLRSNE
jgi:hypothetical protein